jgi:hypothetical protein
MENKIGNPECLKNLHYYVRTSDDALEVMTELRTFFLDDRDLMYFADWLEVTVKQICTCQLACATSDP